MSIFLTFFFIQYWPGKYLLSYCRTKKLLTRLWKQEVKKVEKLTFSKRVNPWFWSKNGHFNTFFFAGNIGQKNVFYDIPERKYAFLGYKKKKSKKSKNWHFSNFFFLGNIGQENLFYFILERKNAFLGYKNRTSKKLKNWHFSKRG